MDHHHACGVTSRRDILRSAACVAGSALLPSSVFAQAAATPARRIDTHFHFFPPALRDVIGGARMASWSPQSALDHMDKNQVASSVLSLASIPEDWFRRDAAWLRKTVRTANDYAAQMVRDHGKRFGLWGFLPMTDVEGSLLEIEYLFETLKADGIGIATNYGDKWPGDPTFAPIFAELNRRKAVVYFHPNSAFCCGDNLVLNVNTSWLEYPHDTSRAVLSLLLNGTLVRNRDIKFLFSHGGGTIPMLAGRVAGTAERGVKNIVEVAPNGVEAELKLLYYDTAIATSASSMAALLNLVAVSQVVFGSDYPYRTQNDNLADLAKLGLPAPTLRAIETDNALRLVPRFKT